MRERSSHDRAAQKTNVVPGLATLSWIIKMSSLLLFPLLDSMMEQQATSCSEHLLVDNCHNTAKGYNQVT